MAVPHLKGLSESERFDRIGWTVVAGGCWEWDGYISPKGYGRFNFSTGNLAHRYALMRYLGRELTPGMSVMHSCDNTKCVNPKHLSEGTHEENMRDSVVRRRKTTKLSAADVIDIYKRANEKSDYVNVIAQGYGVAAATVRAIRDGRNWKWLTQEENK
jgi:hypothetical protein